jgi:hypothetical protein
MWQEQPVVGMNHAALLYLNRTLGLDPIHLQ